jgi:hypothetical protein
VVSARRSLLLLAVGLAVAGCGGSSERPTLGALTEADAFHASALRVVVDAKLYDLAATCYDAGAGSVVVVGTGTEPGTGRETRALVQASVGQSYVGLTIGDREVVYEATLDEPLDLRLGAEHRIEAPAIPFVRDLDLTRGQGQAAGTGSLRVQCAAFVAGSPPGLER